MRICCGIDAGWRTSHVAIVSRRGVDLAAFPITNDRQGVNALTHELARHAQRRNITIAIEDPAGLLAASLTDRGYEVRHILPVTSAHYRRDLVVSGAKSDATDARLLAEMIRTQPLAHHRRPVFSDELLALRVYERAHQDALWARQRAENRLRAVLQTFYPEASKAFRELHHPFALTSLRLAPTPAAARSLRARTLAKALAEHGLRRDVTAASATILEHLRTPTLRRPTALEDAYGIECLTLVHEIGTLRDGELALAGKAMTAYADHPDFAVYNSFPALHRITGARMLGEIGDDPHRFRSSKGVQALAGTLPVTHESGTARLVHRRYAYNRRLGHAALTWVKPLVAASPAARAQYQRHRDHGDRYPTAARKVANRYLGLLWHCVVEGELYREPD